MREPPAAKATLYAREPYHLGLYIPGLPGMNTGATRAHAMMQSRRAAEERQLICVLVPLRMRPKVPLQRARVTMTRHSSVAPDDENNRLAMKAYLDALTRSARSTRGKWISRADVLHDDGPKYLERVYLWQPAPPKKGYVTIMVEELPSEQPEAVMQAGGMR